MTVPAKDTLSKIFASLSDDKALFVDGGGNRLDRSILFAKMFSPELLCSNAFSTLLFLLFSQNKMPASAGTMLLIAAAANFFALIPSPNYSVRAMFRMAGSTIPVPDPITIAKTPGITSLRALEMLCAQDDMARKELKKEGVLCAVAAGGIGLALSTGIIHPLLFLPSVMIVFLSPVIAYGTVKNTRMLLRNRMVNKGHWHAIAGKPPTRIGPPSPDLRAKPA